MINQLLIDLRRKKYEFCKAEHKKTKFLQTIVGENGKFREAYRITSKKMFFACMISKYYMLLLDIIPSSQINKFIFLHSKDLNLISGL